MGFGAKEVLFTCVVIKLLLVLTCGSEKIIDPDHPELVRIRDHIMKAYYLRPDPILQCSFQEHNAAVKLYTTQISEKEQEEAILDMQASMVKSEDNYFVGLPETISALASTKVKYIIYWEGLMVNSATYRNPLSGKTVTLHHHFTPAFTEISRNYTDPATGCFMEIVSCYPFPKWVSKFFKNYVPKPLRLENEAATKSVRSMFVRASGGIGGRFTEVVKFTDNKWLENLYQTNSIRQSLLLRAFPDITKAIETAGADNLSDNGSGDYSDDLSGPVSDGPLLYQRSSRKTLRFLECLERKDLQQSDPLTIVSTCLRSEFHHLTEIRKSVLDFFGKHQALTEHMTLMEI